MKKSLIDMSVTANLSVNNRSVLLKMTPADGSVLPECKPGQFVEMLVEGEPKAFLRRPISINYVDVEKNELWLLIQKVGAGTLKLAEAKEGDIINIIYPLGNGFTMPNNKEQKLLLVGGGVGVAPLLMLGTELKKAGHTPVFLLGARTKDDLLLLDKFKEISEVYVTTEDASEGEKGFVTQHSVLTKEKFDFIYCCGPGPMMKAVAQYANKVATECEVSLENKMACGIGACLCCVEDTTNGNVCVCKEGPVFNIKRLKW